MRYLIEPRDMGKNISKNININISGKYSQKLIDRAKNSATSVFSTASKRAIKKTAEATDDLIGNKSTDKVTRAIKSKSISPTQTEDTTNNLLEIPKEIYKTNLKIDKKLLITFD